MKTIITTIAVAANLSAGVCTAHALTGFAPGDISAESGFAFESEYSFRGVKIGGASLQPGMEIGILDGYAGTWMSMPLDRTPLGDNEVDFYGGYVFPLGDKAALDIGYTYYWYPSEALGHGHDSEPYAGVAFDTEFDPAIYAFYEHKADILTLEGSAGHAYDLAELGLAGTALELGMFLGYVFADDDDDYLYYGATADIVYALSDAVAFSAGVRYSGNNENLGPAADQIWWGTTLGIAY